MVCTLLLLAALVAATRGLVRHSTWYLASDQFAFLTFADDLAMGRVFHDPTVVRLLAGPALGADEAADALYQTYFWRDGRLYSRYPPGYPLLLAATGMLGGEPARRILNPALFLVLLVAGALVAARTLDHDPSSVRLAAAVAVPWLLLLVPADVHYWGLTVVRDLPAHLLGLLSVLAALDGWFPTSALLLGFACSIRPDCMLYGASIVTLGWGRQPTRRALVLGGLGFLLGTAPLFAYNTVTQGSPLSFTQGGEFRALLSALDPVRAALAQGGPPLLPSGGAFRLSNLTRTLPAHLSYLAHTFGLFALVAATTLLWALAHRRRLAAALGSYLVVALVFYSCWAHPDPRYLVGASLCVVVAAAVGSALWCAALVAAGRRLGARLTALALTVLAPVALWSLVPLTADRRQLALEVPLVACAALLGTMALLARPRRLAARIAPLVPALVLATIGVTRIATGGAERDPFQRPQIERARAALETLLPAAALVLTTPALGRPAENIAYYTHAAAYYAGELPLLRSTVDQAVHRAQEAGRHTFLLLGATETPPLIDPQLRTALRVVARRDGPALRDWFVDPRRAPAGAVLYEVAPPAR